MELGRLVVDRQVLSSRVASVEVTKAVKRRDPHADPTAVFGRLSWIELDAETAAVASATGEPQLRALDAIHIASALRVGPDIEAFVTYDARQATAAASVGLHVLSPGAEPA